MALHRHPPSIAFSIACLGSMLLTIPMDYCLKVLDEPSRFAADTIEVRGRLAARCGKICDACVTSRRGAAELLRFTLAGDIWCQPLRTKLSIFLGSTAFAPSSDRHYLGHAQGHVGRNYRRRHVPPLRLRQRAGHCLNGTNLCPGHLEKFTNGPGQLVVKFG